MNRSILGITTLALCFGAFFLVPAAFAYGGNLGQPGGATLEEQLMLAERKVEYAAANPASGSGTPYLDATGVVGASVIAGAIFGGIATAFFVRGRYGRYAAYGRG